MRFFFYGTLLDADVRRAVLGGLAPRRVERATLRGWRRRQVAGGSHPVIVRVARGRVRGAIARGLGARERDLLVAYEDDGYAMLAVRVRTARGREDAVVFVANRRKISAARRGWSLPAWQRTSKRAWLTELARGGSPAQPPASPAGAMTRQSMSGRRSRAVQAERA